MKTLAVLSQILLLGLGTFLMIVILLQRGRGGGLAGAFGGLGGQSAFGTKAGDVFTKITIVLAVAWVIVAGGSGYFLRAGAEERASGLGDSEVGISADELPAEDEDFNAFGDAETPPAPANEVPAGDTRDADATPAAETEGEETSTSPPAEASPPANENATPGDPSSDANSASDPESESPAEPSESPEQQ